MALKKKLDKAAFDALTKDVQKEYTANGDHYLLDLADDDAAELRRAKDREAQDAAQLRKDLKALQDKIAELEGAGGSDKNKETDIAKLTASFESKLAKLNEKFEGEKKALTDKQAQRDMQTRKSMIDAAAAAIATKISTVPTIMATTLATRFDVDFTGDEPKLVVLDASGKPSAMTPDQLSKEFLANKEFAGILIGNKASGSGAPRDGNTPRKPSGAGGTGDETPADFSKMTGKQLADHLKERKAQQQQT